MRAAGLALLLSVGAQGQVVINEIFYHAPADLVDMQWIELHNATDQSVDVGGWTLSQGVRFTFPDGAKIAARGYAVVCRKRDVFGQHYSVPVAGEFKKALKHSGEPILLRDRAGGVVDEVIFGNRPPWPRGADGGTASLERICPTVSGKRPENWAASALAADAGRPGGTPGQRNSVCAASLPPVIREVTFKPDVAAPGQAVTVEATVMSEGALREVALLSQAVSAGLVGDLVVVAMAAGGATNRYVGTLTAPAAGTILRFRIRATDARSAVRLYPGESEPRPALACLVFTNLALGAVPGGQIVHTDSGAAERVRRARPNRGPGPGGPPDEAMMARFGLEMQLRTQLDLAELWVGLTLTNGTFASRDRLAPVFVQAELDRAEFERKRIEGGEPQRVLRELPEALKGFKGRLGEALAPVLDAGQAEVFAAWRDRAPVGGGGRFGFGGNPGAMLRQFIRLEPGYLYLSTRTNLTAAQFDAVREAYREAIQQRDRLGGQAGRLMGLPWEGGPEREEMQAKVEAIEPGIERRLATVLTREQLRAFAEWREQNAPGFMGFGGERSAPEPARGRDAFVYIDPATGKPRLFDFAHIPERSGGWKVHFARDESLDGMTGINLIFEASDRWVLAEPLAYEFYRRTGQAVPHTEFVRLTVDGQPLGYHLLIEQPNKSFLRRNGLRDDGNLYKANWRGRGLTGQHEKRVSATPGHEDLIRLVDEVGKAKGDPEAQWGLIKREFDVGQVINHYAIRLIASDWDGFFNNYYLYHDLHGTKKWLFFPWDQDQVWGDAMNFGGPGGLLTTLPLGYGAEGDRPSGRGGQGLPGGFLGGGGAPWWRAGGYLSRPLLANRLFKGMVLARIKELLELEFTEARLGPWLDQCRERLTAEVRYRATVGREDPERALARFEANLRSLREFIGERRKWLLEQREIQEAGAYDRSRLN